MGEMIKFGIKLALTIATAVALVAAVAILYSIVSDLLLPSVGGSGWYAVFDISRLISLLFPINLTLLFTIITSLFSFKVAYWAADKMIQFISASS